MTPNDHQKAQALDLRFLNSEQVFTEEELERMETTGFPKEGVSGKKEFFRLLFILLTAAIASPFITMYVVNAVLGA